MQHLDEVPNGAVDTMDSTFKMQYNVRPNESRDYSGLPEAIPRAITEVDARSIHRPFTRKVEESSHARSSLLPSPHCIIRSHDPTYLNGRDQQCLSNNALQHETIL